MLELRAMIGEIFTVVEFSGERTPARRVLLGCLTVLFLLVGASALAYWLWTP